MKKIRVLQIDYHNWQERFDIPDTTEWFFVTPDNIASVLTVEKEQFLKSKGNKMYDAVIANIPQELSQIMLLDKWIDVYRLFYPKNSKITSKTLEKFLFKKQAHAVDFDHPQELINTIAYGFYAGQSGTKLPINHLVVSQMFEGNTSFKGSSYLSLGGYFGEDFKQLATYQYNIFADPKRPIEIWPEFRVSQPAQIRYRIRAYSDYDPEATHLQEWLYDQKQFNELLCIQASQCCFLTVSIEAKGYGNIQIGPCHYRDSHLGYGDMLVGGNRIVDSQREELIYFFHPGDLKPPLNIYFSGYRSAEGFEGYWLMNNLGAPFLLVGDPRAEGGAFYLGSQELENKLVKVIQNCLDKLGFTNEQLTMSGLSMGTFGSLYYGSLLSPRAIILGKPLANLGEMAQKEATTRPGGFPTSLDLVFRISGELSDNGAKEINQRFWDIFNQANFSNTKFLIAYMMHDDYDETAYNDLLEQLGRKNYPVQVISKGLVGRHNDDSDGIIEWYYTQYKNFLTEQFGREFPN